MKRNKVWRLNQGRFQEDVLSLDPTTQHLDDLQLMGQRKSRGRKLGKEANPSGVGPLEEKHIFCIIKEGKPFGFRLDILFSDGLCRPIAFFSCLENISALFSVRAFSCGNALLFLGDIVARDLREDFDL